MRVLVRMQGKGGRKYVFMQIFVFIQIVFILIEIWATFYLIFWLVNEFSEDKNSCYLFNSTLYSLHIRHIVKLSIIDAVTLNDWSLWSLMQIRFSNQNEVCYNWLSYSVYSLNNFFDVEKFTEIRFRLSYLWKIRSLLSKSFWELATNIYSRRSDTF